MESGSRRGYRPAPRLRPLRFSTLHDTHDEVSFPLRISDAVIRMLGGEPELELAVLTRGLGVPDQVITEEQPVPVLAETRFDHVDVVGTDTAGTVALYEPGVKRRH